MRPDRKQQLAGGLDVAGNEVVEQVFRRRLCLARLAQLLVVGRAAQNCPLEDRRVRGHSDDSVIGHELGQPAALS